MLFVEILEAIECLEFAYNVLMEWFPNRNTEANLGKFYLLTSSKPNWKSADAMTLLTMLNAENY